MADERKLISTCYDHLSGILGEELFKHFVKKDWIRQKAEGRDYDITSDGWKQLKMLGINEETLIKSKRKILSPCIERHKGIIYEHLGAHLGTLICERFFELGWIEKTDEKQYVLTEAGITGLKSLEMDLTFINSRG